MAADHPHPYVEPMHPVQVEGFRKMTPAQKLEIMRRMRESAIELRRIGLRMRHPDWPEEQIEREARHAAMYATT